MKTEYILTRINAIIALKPDLAVKHELDLLAADLSAQVRMEYASKTGAMNATRTITAMLTHMKKHDGRPALQYQWTDSNGRQCVCDGFRAFRLLEPLPLEERPKEAGSGIDLGKIFPENLAGYEALRLPTLSDVKAHIALERARYTGKRTGFNPLWSFGERMPTISAEYLRDLLIVLGNAAEIFWNPKTPHGPLYAKSKKGDALVMPVMHNVSAADAVKASQERRAAEQRSATIREDARKDYEAQCEDYRRRIERDPNAALTPDEFERLTRYADWENAA